MLLDPFVVAPEQYEQGTTFGQGCEGTNPLIYVLDAWGYTESLILPSGTIISDENEDDD